MIRTPFVLVVEEDGRVWLSEFGARDAAPRGGEAVAVVGPLELPAARSYSVVLSYAVMRPGDSSRVHTHPGPEGWYVLAGEQCLETPAGASKAGAGRTMAVPPNVPMELNVTGTTIRRAFALVVHDAPVHDDFGQVVDLDGTVLLSLHKWGAHGHPSLTSPEDATPGNGLILFFRVGDIETALPRARALVSRLEEEPHVNPNTGTMEFSLRDRDGYYVTISALSAA